MISLLIGIAAVAMILGGLVFWLLPGARKPARAIAAILFIVVLLGLADAGISLLGYAKPMAVEWQHRGLARAIDAAEVFRPGEAIFVWLILPGGKEPIAYSLPWSAEMANQLMEAREAAEGRGTEVTMRLPFGDSWAEGDPVFYADPQPPLPVKDIPPAPQTYTPDTP